MVAMAPTMPATLPAAMESLPSDGPTVPSLTTVSFAGRAPDLSWIASLVAVAGVKLPSM